MLGALFVAIGVGLAVMFMFGDSVGFFSSPMEVAGVTAALLAGSVAIRTGLAERARLRACGETREPAARERPLTSAPLGPPPRIGDDPFRDPPGRPPIVVERHGMAPITAPIVPGDPSDRPRVLT
ncbi:MAG: hypothetical protein H7138_26485 [Myxococcales bacterium]|nr:hypothetical protein [Myxococcales bacterium]